MGDFNSRRVGEATQYVSIAAASTVILGTNGAYLERMTIIPNTTGAATVVLSDGSTAVVSIPAAAHAVSAAPYTVNYGMRATGAGWKVVTGTSVAAIAVGWFGDSAATVTTA